MTSVGTPLPSFVPWEFQVLLLNGSIALALSRSLLFQILKILLEERESIIINEVWLGHGVWGGAPAGGGGTLAQLINACIC